MLPPPASAFARPAVPAAKKTVGIGLASLLRSAEMPNTKPRASSMPAQPGELPPGFFDADATDETDDAQTGASVAVGSRGLNSLLSMLPPPSRGRAVAAAAPMPQPAQPPPTQLLPAKRQRPADGPEGSAAAGLRAPLLAGVSYVEDESSDSEDDGAAGAGPAAEGNPGGLAGGHGGYGGVTAPYPGGGDEEEEEEGVTAPYPGGDEEEEEGPTAPYAGSYGAHAFGGGASSAQAQQPSSRAHVHVPDEFLSKAERRALADAQASGDGMAAFDQGELQRTYRPANEVVVNRPAADVKVEGRVFNRSTGVTELTAKPTGTQKRKHQINHLAHQYYQNAAELDQRGKKGLKSKSETGARYGW
ncbi:hypothetical protein T492DRAFT_999496 [Pavlovales sp. CCMP2436]|nr:hypothetical protein T492DRAFT_999496 [Pavlovales sp. CCMP2436]